MADNINCLIFFISCIILLQKYKNNLINLRNLWFILYLCTRIYSEPYKMRQLRKSFWCTLVLLTTTILPTNADNHISSKLVINELMQSNIDCIMDDLNEFPDSWVELYNASDETVFLKDYQIGTDAGDPWQLPFMTVEPKCFVLVYCDKEASGRHTDFRLETGKGCMVYLYQGGEKVDSLPAALPKMPAPNIAYGRKTDGGSEWDYQLTPTPGAANSGEVCDGDHILGEPIFSQKGYVQNGKQAFRVTLSLPEGTPDGTEIRYTTDGSEPTADSNQCPASGIPVRKSTTIRAKLFCGGWLSPRSTVESYIFHDRITDGKVYDVGYARLRYSADERGVMETGCVFIIHDVTARYELDKSRREFVANVSHELRTPITSIRGFADPRPEARCHKLQVRRTPQCRQRP